MRHILMLFLFVVLIGCGAGANTQRTPQIVTVPQPGNPQSFIVYITNNTQVDLAIPSLTGGAFPQALIIPPGPNNTVAVQLGLLPSSITIDAQTVTVPVYTFQTVTLTLGQQYNNFSTYVSVSFP